MQQWEKAMVVLRQRIETGVELNGGAFRLIVTRDFVAKWLCRRQISDGEFFDFVNQNGGLLAQFARRKLQRWHMTNDRMVIDSSDLSY